MAIPAECEEYWHQASASAKGIAITLETPGTAINFMQKMNQFRSRYRDKSRRIYPPDDPKHGKTPWDDFVVRKDKNNACRVLIEPAKIEIQKVEEL